MSVAGEEEENTAISAACICVGTRGRQQGPPI